VIADELNAITMWVHAAVAGRQQLPGLPEAGRLTSGGADGFCNRWFPRLKCNSVVRPEMCALLCSRIV
jgi:hypothetical protein